MKSTINHSDAVIGLEGASKFNKIYRVFRKTFYLRPKDTFAGSALQ
jgi:hypothetical protein